MKTSRKSKTGLSIFYSLFLSVILISAGSRALAQEKETRDVGSFSSISLSISGDLYLTQGNDTKVVIEAEQKILDLIRTEVVGDNLKIKFKTGKWNIRSNKQINIYVSTPDVEGLFLSGSGNIKAETQIKTEGLDFAISGSGNIVIDDLVVSDLEGHTSGSGDINLSGSETVETMEISISGSGDLFAENLKVNDVEISISGSGTCKVFAVSELEAYISGSGSVYYKGNPMVNAKVSGSGKVRSLD
ncbi:MAG: DUF2807 domain-containing protein [Bacteroidetes bacterium]|nr:DUF2807 domain-containing protein [Bacteroidota bacterium]